MHPARAPQVNPGATEPLDVLRGNAARIPYLEGIGPRRRFQVGGSGPSVRGIQPHAPRPAPGLFARVLRGAAGPIDSDSKLFRCRERFCRRPTIEGAPREEGCCCCGRGWRVVGRVRWHGAGRAGAGRLGRVRPREGVEVGGAGRRQRSPSHAPHVMRCPFSCPEHGHFEVELTGKLPTSWPCPSCGAESPDVSF